MSDDRTRFEAALDLGKARVMSAALDAFKDLPGQAKFFSAVTVLCSAAFDIAHENNELIQLLKLNAETNAAILADWVRRGATIKEI